MKDKKIAEVAYLGKSSSFVSRFDCECDFQHTESKVVFVSYIRSMSEFPKLTLKTNAVLSMMYFL